jgi:hypothetical protein
LSAVYSAKSSVDAVQHAALLAAPFKERLARKIANANVAHVLGAVGRNRAALPVKFGKKAEGILPFGFEAPPELLNL